MANLPIVTKTSDIDIKSVYGQSIFDFYPQLKKILQQQPNGPELSQFFSEPVLNNVRGEVTWFTPISGPVKSLSDMTPDERRWAGEKIKSYTQMVNDAANHLVQMSGPKSLGAEALRNALVTPHLGDSLFLVGDKLVMAQWGCVPYGVSSRDFDLVTEGQALGIIVDNSPEPETPKPQEPEVPKPPEPEVPKLPEPELPKPPEPAPPEPEPLKPPEPEPLPEPEPPEPEPPKPLTLTEILWRWLVILLLTLLLLAGLLMKGCTYTVFGTTENEDQLRTEIASLWVKVQEKVASCLPKEPIQQIPEKKNEEPKRVPDLTEGVKNKDLKAFNGSWELITGLINVATGEPIIMYLQFDDKGLGNLTINSKQSSATCSGRARAKFDSQTAFTVSMDKCVGSSANSSYASDIGSCNLIPNTNKAKCVITCNSGPCGATFQRRN
jgi:hypothetical protein